MFKSITFEVTGDQLLHCESCEHRVKHALKALPGVGQVRAYAGKQRIDVLFDAEKQDLGAIQERISKLGYQTRVAS